MTIKNFLQRFFFSAFFIFISGCATFPRQIPSLPPKPYGIYHIVESGQTLYKIARTYNVDISQIMRLNKINDPSVIDVGQALFIPGAKAPLPVGPIREVEMSSVERVVSRHKTPSAAWRYITIHHSATLEGNARMFDRNHRSRKMGGLFYHFVIGNGTHSDDGEIEVGWRWKRQVYANRPFDIQICLVGDFNRQNLRNAQFDSLVCLINVLRKRYNISLSNIRRHKDIEGKVTACPGENFPFYDILSELKNIK